MVEIERMVYDETKPMVNNKDKVTQLLVIKDAKGPKTKSY